MKLREFIRYSMSFGLVLFAILATACGGAKQANDSSSKTSAPSNANSTNATSSSNSTSNSTSETKSDKVTLETSDNDEKIKPDSNAVLENGKKMSDLLYFDITLPAGWKAKKSDYGYEFTPPKVTEDGIAGAYFMLTLAREDEQPVNNKRAMLESKLQSNKEAKEKDYIQYAGTLGILSAENSVIIGATSVRDKVGAGADPKAKCSLKDIVNCGKYDWDGYYGDKYHSNYYLAIIYPPGTYEKNKPVIDAIINSVHLH